MRVDCPPSLEPSAFSSHAPAAGAGAGAGCILADLRAMLAEHARHAGSRPDPREPITAARDRINERFRAGWRD